MKAALLVLSDGRFNACSWLRLSRQFRKRTVLRRRISASGATLMSMTKLPQSHARVQECKAIPVASNPDSVDKQQETRPGQTVHSRNLQEVRAACFRLHRSTIDPMNLPLCPANT